MSKPSKLEGYKSDRCQLLYTFRRSLPLRQRRELNHCWSWVRAPEFGRKVSHEFCKEKLILNWTVANILARLICVVKNHMDYHVVSVVV
jgi:hypothetical protein